MGCRQREIKMEIGRLCKACKEKMGWNEQIMECKQREIKMEIGSLCKACKEKMGWN